MNNLREALKLCDMTQKEFAHRIDISESWVSRIVNGEKPLETWMIRPLIEYGLDSNWIMGYKSYDKDDEEKLKVSLVPPEIIEAIAKVREYGTKKYHDKDSWKNVEADRYFDALLRHILACWDDRHAVDEESGLPHMFHVACNVAFIIALEYGDE